MTFTVFLVVHDEYDTYTHRDGIGTCIGSLALLGNDVPLVIVNNADIDRCPMTTSFLRNVCNTRKNTLLVETHKNLGCAGGFNKGFESAAVSSDVLIYMSPDAVIVDPKTLRCMENVFDGYPEIGLAHPVSIYEDTEEYNYSKEFSSVQFTRKARFYGTKDAWENSSDDPVLITNILNKIKSRILKPAYPTISVPLTFLAIRRELYELLNGFDGNFFVGGENTDFTLRALQNGFSAALINNTYVHHRRLFFKYIGSGGENNRIALDGQTVVLDYWRKKWKFGWEDIYGELIFGARRYRFAVKPIRKIRTMFVRIVSQAVRGVSRRNT